MSVSYNSDADLVVSRKHGQVLAANPINQLIGLQPAKEQEMLVETVLARTKDAADPKAKDKKTTKEENKVIKEEKKHFKAEKDESEEQRRKRLKKDKEDFANMLHNEYVMNPKTQDRMNAFYNQ